MWYELVRLVKQVIPTSLITIIQNKPFSVNIHKDINAKRLKLEGEILIYRL